MNIGMISYYLPSENKIGSGYQAHYMANALARRGHRVTMFSPVSRPIDALYQLERVPVGKSCRIFRFAKNLRQVDWSRFDVLHAHGDDYLLFARKHPVHVRTMHGSCIAESLHVPGIKEKLRMFLLGMSELVAFGAADATIGVSQNTTRSYPWIKRVILNGVDTTAFTPGEKEATPTILFVGTYLNRKRGKLLADAFQSTILPAIPNARLWMVCSDAPKMQNVDVLGKLSTAELADRYRRAWVFCLPSSYEGFGVPYIEAMASRTAVVATPNPGSIEVLGNGQYGTITDPAQLGESLLHLLRNQTERDRLAQTGFERSKIFAWDHIAAQYESLYADLGAKSTNRASEPLGPFLHAPESA